MSLLCVWIHAVYLNTLRYTADHRSQVMFGPPEKLKDPVIQFPPPWGGTIIHSYFVESFLIIKNKLASSPWTEFNVTRKCAQDQMLACMQWSNEIFFNYFHSSVTQNRNCTKHLTSFANWKIQRWQIMIESDFGISLWTDTPVHVCVLELAMVLMWTLHLGLQLSCHLGVFPSPGPRNLIYLNYYFLLNIYLNGSI